MNNTICVEEKMKKVIALILSIVMVLSLALTFAAMYGTYLLLSSLL